MTNFAVIMDLLKISPKFFSDYGFDHTLISRWRTGKRRLMPGRYQVEELVKLFWLEDGKKEEPVLEQLLRIWYPASRSDSDSEKQWLLQEFLTEKGQTESEYIRMRTVRLSPLQNKSAPSLEGPKGIEAVRLGLLHFLDLISALPNAQQINFVFTEGQFIYLSEENFGRLFMHKLMKLFEAGHRLAVAIRSDRVASDILYFHKPKLFAHLKGYITTRYFDVFMPCNDKILGTVGDSLAFRVTREKLWDFDNTSIEIFGDKQSVAEITSTINDYLSISHPLMRYDFFNNPDGYLSQISIHHNRPCSIITKIPHFGVLGQEETESTLSLNEEEKQLLHREYHPIFIDPTYFEADTRVRYIFCEQSILAALTQKRHQVHEISAMLGRKVWMSTEDLVLQLKRIRQLLQALPNFEVCFLDKSIFADISLQVAVWGNEAVITWLEKGSSASCREYPIVSGMQMFCSTVWDEIPNEMRSRQVVIQKINGMLRQLRAVHKS